MPKIDIKKTELVWKGKYDDDGKLVPVEKPGPYPFQIVEVINEPRIGHQQPRQGSLFDIWKGDEGATFEEGWKNKLIWGDNKFVMSSLLEKFAGKIDLIYIDPPFATGADFRMRIEIGEKGEEVTKEHSVIEEKAYRDTWGKGVDSFLQMMHQRIILLKDLLAENGSLFIHVDYRMCSAIRIILDEIFGSDNFVNEIVWCYSRPSIAAQKTFTKLHDNIYWYCKNKGNQKFNADSVRIEYSERTKERNKYGAGGSKYAGGTDERKTHDLGKIPEDYWYIPLPPGNSSEVLGYPTQKPEALIDRIIKATSSEGDLVADVFCGSGTTLAVAEKLGRRWIGVDLGRFAIHTTRKQLLEIEESKGLLNEGKTF